MEENKQPSLLKSTINYGAMLGLALVIVTLLAWMFDILLKPGFSYVGYALIIIGIVLATINFRDQEQGGSITYGRALGVGFLTTLFAGIVISLFSYLLYTLIDPTLIEKTYAMMEEGYYDAGMTDDQIETAMNMVKRFSNPPMMALIGLLTYMFMGLVFSLVTSIFLKKEGDPFTSERV